MSLLEIFQIIFVLFLNILSCYFWVWIYRELFKKNVTIKEIILYGLLSAIGSWSFIRFLGLQTIVAKASAEEVMKISSSFTGRKSQDLSLNSDYISFALICWIGFGIIENIIYLYYTFNDWIASAGISRIITNTLLHSLFSGSIGYGIYLFAKRRSRKYIWILVTWFIVWIGLHSLYNRSLTQSLLAINILLIIGGYYLLAFLLYQSDRLFIDNQTNVNWKV